LIEAGHSVIVIEHQLDIIRSSDWIIDIGPGSADLGGEVVYTGPPSSLKHCARSETGKVV
jgi:excinuclease ABC subunit A